jgi:nitrate reductase delta subunit
MTPADERAALAAYAALFAYPGGDLGAAAARIAALVGRGAREGLERFGAWLARTSPAEREEEHTAVFDLEPACPPYVGFHLVGDGPPRGAFLARLAGVYRARGFVPEGELPDHLAVVLRFLSEADGPDRDALLSDGVVPALGGMRAALGEGGSPYRDLVESLAAFVAEAAAPAAAPAAREVPA